MTELEKVLKVCRICRDGAEADCPKCPYNRLADGTLVRILDCTAKLASDALDLLNEYKEDHILLERARRGEIVLDYPTPEQMRDTPWEGESDD